MFMIFKIKELTPDTWPLIQLMLECYKFMMHKFTIWGYTFSLFNIACFVEVARISLKTVKALFGAQEVETDD